MARKEVILWISDKGLRIYGEGLALEDTWPEGLIKEAKIVDEEKVRERVREFMDKTGLTKYQVRLVVGSDLVTEKILGQWDKETKKKLEDFVVESVYGNEDTWVKLNKIGKDIKVVGVPKKLVETIEDRLIRSGVRVAQTISESELEKRVDDRSKNNEMRELFGELKKKASLSFRGEVGFDWGKYLLGLVVFMVVGIGVFSLWRWNFEKQKIQAEVKPQEAVVTPTPTPTPLPRLAIKIMNGTGVTGQAAEVAKGLTMDWVGEISTGNFKGGSKRNQIIFQKDFDPQLKLKVVTDVSSVLSDLEVLEAKDAQEEPIVIVTGK